MNTVNTDGSRQTYGQMLKENFAAGKTEGRDFTGNFTGGGENPPAPGAGAAQRATGA
jgi:hypothetical protein